MPTSSGGVLGRPQCLQRMLACRMQRHRPSEAVHAPPRTDAWNSAGRPIDRVDHRDRMRASSSAAAARLPWRRVQAGSTAQGGQTVADHVGRACRSREVFFYGWLVRLQATTPCLPAKFYLGSIFQNELVGCAPARLADKVEREFLAHDLSSAQHINLLWRGRASRTRSVQAVQARPRLPASRQPAGTRRLTSSAPGSCSFLARNFLRCWMVALDDVRMYGFSKL